MKKNIILVLLVSLSTLSACAKSKVLEVDFLECYRIFGDKEEGNFNNPHGDSVIFQAYSLDHSTNKAEYITRVGNKRTVDFRIIKDNVVEFKNLDSDEGPNWYLNFNKKDDEYMILYHTLSNESQKHSSGKFWLRAENDEDFQPNDVCRVSTRKIFDELSLDNEVVKWESITDGDNVRNVLIYEQFFGTVGVKKEDVKVIYIYIKETNELIIETYENGLLIKKTTEEISRIYNDIYYSRSEGGQGFLTELHEKGMYVLFNSSGLRMKDENQTSFNATRVYFKDIYQEDDKSNYNQNDNSSNIGKNDEEDFDIVESDNKSENYVSNSNIQNSNTNESDKVDKTDSDRLKKKKDYSDSLKVIEKLESSLQSPTNEVYNSAYAIYTNINYQSDEGTLMSDDISFMFINYQSLLSEYDGTGTNIEFYQNQIKKDIEVFRNKYK